MKTIVLVVPPMTSEERYGPFHRIMGRGNIRPHLGLLSIGAVLKKAGHEVHLVDGLASQLSPEEAAREVLRKSPQIVAITAYSLSFFNAAEIARRINKTNNRVLTVIGGPHLTAIPEETMGRFESFDVGVIGEGEATIAEVAASGDVAELRNIRTRPPTLILCPYILPGTGDFSSEAGGGPITPARRRSQGARRTPHARNGLDFAHPAPAKAPREILTQKRVSYI